MTVLVTGASGHIGGNLVRALLEQGRTVRVLVREDRRAVAGLEVEEVRGDVLEMDSLKAACREVEVVYHLAAYISISGQEEEKVREVNVEGTTNVLAACRAEGVGRLVHFSSIHALCAEPPGAMIDEERPLTPADYPLVYDRSKGEAQQRVRQAVADGLDAIVLNPTAVLGPLDYKPSHMGQVLLDLYHGALPALVHGGFDWVDVRDVVQATLVAEERAAAGEEFLLSGEWRSIAEVAQLAKASTQRATPRFVSPMWLARLGAPFLKAFAQWTGKRPLYTKESLRSLCNHRYISHNKATQQLDYHPRPLEETIRDSYAWFGENGYLARG